MLVEGEVVSSVHRGAGLVEKFGPRLIGALGFKPASGTLNIKLDKTVGVIAHSTKTLEFRLTDGTRKIDAYLAPVKIKTAQKMLRGIPIEGDESVTLYKWKGKDAFSLRKDGKFVTWDLIRNDSDRELIDYLKSRQSKENKKENIQAEAGECKCWAIHFTTGPQDKLSLEIVADVSLREKMGLADGDRVQIEFLK